MDQVAHGGKQCIHADLSRGDMHKVLKNVDAQHNEALAPPDPSCLERRGVRRAADQYERARHGGRNLGKQFLDFRRRHDRLADQPHVGTPRDCGRNHLGCQVR